MKFTSYTTLRSETTWLFPPRYNNKLNKVQIVASKLRFYNKLLTLEDTIHL
jgi:hypothetical protein